MSDSTRAKKTRKQRSSPFMVVSFAMHAGGLALLMLYAPAREAVFGRPDPKMEPEVRLEGEALANLTEQIRDINRETLAAAAIELEAIQQEMEMMRADKAREFEDVAAQRMDSSIARAPGLLEQITTAQELSLEQQQKAAGKQEAFDAARDAAAREQSKAETSQQQLVDVLEYSGANKEIKQQQDAAGQAQVEATRALAGAKLAAVAARSAETELPRKHEELNQFQQQLVNEKAARENAQKWTSEAPTRLAKAEAWSKDAAEKLTALGAQTRPTDKNAVRQRDEVVRNAREEAKRAQEELRSAQKHQRDADMEQKRREAAVAAAALRLEKTKQAVDELEKKRLERDRTADEKIRNAEQLQKKANEMQLAAADAVKQAIQQGIKRVPGDVDPRPTAGVALYTSSIGELYEHLVDAEKKVAQSYREFRATDLALITDVSPKRAMQQIDVPQPNRPVIDRKITELKVTEGEQYKKHAEAVQTAVRESDSIVTASRNLLDAARQSQAHGAGGFSVALADRSRRAKEIEQASHEEQGGKVVDMAAVMRQAAPMPVQAGAEPESPAKPRMPIPTRNQPPQVRDVDVTAPARIVAGGAPAAKWVFVDSWYTIGPFPNPGRANIHRSFAPESTVNLDAIYDGMFGPVKWQFLQSPRPMVEPANAVEYGIWYAYTELLFDQDRDLWIAVGSDDRSDLWINDVRVWSSSDILKGWQIGEGLRRVHFQRGRNKVVYRIENGWHSIAFSMCIFLGERP